MTEKEKMLNGKPFRFDEELNKEREYSRELCFDYNATRPGEVRKRYDMIKNFFSRTGEKFSIQPPIYCYFGWNISIGENFFYGCNSVILALAKVTIGNNVMLAPNVSLFTSGHPVHYEPRNEKYINAFPITIGNNVWIGGGTIVNSGVTIGDNTVIGSGSVITKNIPANVVAFGNPCRVIREIVDEDRQYYFKKLKFDE